MKNNAIVKICMACVMVFAIVFVSACGNTSNSAVAEKIERAETVLNEVEFSNSDKMKIENKNEVYEVTGEIEALSAAQIAAFGLEDVTHAIVVKFIFDKERTIDSFEIKGNLTKVYSTDKNVANYVGSLSSILDNEEGEDAFCYLILSANTKEYVLTSKYSDSTKSTVGLKITARLVTAVAE